MMTGRPFVMTIAALVLTDPIHRARPLNPAERAAMRIIRDPRDLPFLWLIATVSLTAVPMAALLILDPLFAWWLAAAYLVLVVGCLYLPVLVIYHHITHRPLFRPRYRVLMHYVNWVVGPLFGLFPNGYYAHHIAMHHAENNLGPDLSSTMRYQRDSLLDFLRYVGNFLVSLYGGLALYLWRRKRYRLVRAVLIGEAGYLAIVAATAVFNPKAVLVVFIIPTLAAIVGFCAINWTEHAFVDPGRPDSIYRSAIICVNTAYNRLAFNDGYHICHHLKPNLHWTEMPNEFLAHRATYACEGAIVFHRLNYFSVLFLLLTRQYGVLARHCLDAGSPDETAALLRQRTMKIVSP
jgi:fatty acid desaturase